MARSAVRAILSSLCGPNPKRSGQSSLFLEEYKKKKKAAAPLSLSEKAPQNYRGFGAFFFHRPSEGFIKIKHFGV